MGADGSLKTHQKTLRVVIVTMDTHLASATQNAAADLARESPGLRLTMHAASEWSASESKRSLCLADIEQADILIVTMLFLEEHFQPILDAIAAKRGQCDAVICAMSATEVTTLTQIGDFDMSKPASGPIALLKKLRGKPSSNETGGEAQMKMLRRLPKLLRFIPGTAQDVRAYFLTLQYWLGGSRENMANMVRYLAARYAGEATREIADRLDACAPPLEYPSVGVYHPRMELRIADHRHGLPAVKEPKGRVGLLLLRSYLLGGNAAHYDGVIAALEAQGLEVVPAFASGLDSRPAIEAFFVRDGQPIVDAIVSLTGFSLVGGPAYNDSAAASALLESLDVPYLAAHPVEFQTLDQWGGSERGLSPVESTIMVAIPELDGATNPLVFGGRAGAPGVTCEGCHHRCTFSADDNPQDMHSCPERALALAARVNKLVQLRRRGRANR